MLSPRRTIVGISLAVVAVLVLVVSGRLVHEVGADEIVVIQSPIDGRLDWYTTPGLKWQGFGTVTTYLKRDIYKFEPKDVPEKDRAGGPVGGIVVRFNDGGHGTIFGSVQFELPTDESKLNTMHSKYRTQAALKHDVIETVTNNAVYLVGTLMSSKESYGEKRNDLIHYVMDQIQNGVYRTRQKTEWIKDPVTSQEKQVTMAEIMLDKDGKIERQEVSLLNRMSITAQNFVISQMPYDNIVEQQIRQQQQIAMDVQTSIAEKLKAEQRALTVEQQGRAEATATRWSQEAIKAREVTKADQEKQVATIEAEKLKTVAETQGRQRVAVAELDKKTAETAGAQRLAVAEFDAKAAEQTKRQSILLGEGEATRKKLVLEADGALAQKLEAMIKINEVYANAMRGSNWVPSVVMAGGGPQQNASGGAVDLISLLTAKTAKDLALDLSVPGKPRLAEQVR